MAKAPRRKLTSVLGRVSYFTVLAKSYTRKGHVVKLGSGTEVAKFEQEARCRTAMWAHNVC